MYRTLLLAICLFTTVLVYRAAADPSDPADQVFEQEIVLAAPDAPAPPDTPDVPVPPAAAGAPAPVPPPAVPLPPVPPGPGSFVFIQSEFGGEEKLVKGAPYSADAVTERTQVLEDGNRIIQKNTAHLYRDSEGRTRREQQFGPIGPFAATEDTHTTIFIHDPVKSEDYVLDPDAQTARMMKPGGMRAPLPPPHHAGEEDEDILVPAPAPEAAPRIKQVFRYSGKPADTKTESLGKQKMEGLDVEGTRSTTVIPAGQIGNERDIQVVTEKWYSPDLQVTVMSRHSDPRFGTTTYQLQNIQRGEPDKSLFQVPAGYKVEQGGQIERKVIIKNKPQN